MIARETIYATLFAQGQRAAGFRYTSRRHCLWDALASDQYPALLQTQDGETQTKRDRAIPSIWELRVSWWVYVKVEDPATPHAMLLNPLLDALADALAPPAGSTVQDLGLGDPVSQVRIDGQVEIFEGPLGDYAIAIVPLLIVATLR